MSKYNTPQKGKKFPSSTKELLNENGDQIFFVENVPCMPSFKLNITIDSNSMRCGTVLKSVYMYVYVSK